MPVNEGHRAVSRALHALELTVSAEGGISLGELADGVGAAKSSLHPLLKALVFRGYLVYEGARYRTGPTLGTLAAADSPAIVEVAQPLMNDLLHRFDETVMLGSMVGESLIYLHTVESTQLVRYSPPRVRPPSDHPSSIGKLYLALLDDTELERYVDEQIRPEKRADLTREVREARATGVAFNHGDTFPDLSAVAARIVSGQGLVACLAIGGPSRRIEAGADEMAQALREAAETVAIQLR